MVLSGYARLRYCNLFIPIDIQDHLSKNIGKNNQVVVADYLIGNNAKHNPFLPKHLNQKINQLDIKERTRFVQQCKKMLKYMGQQETNYTKRIIMVTQFFRYLNMKEEYYSLFFANSTIEKCIELLYDIQNIKRKYKQKITHRYNTRSQSKLKSEKEFNGIQLEKATFEISQSLEKLIQYREKNTT